MILWIEKLILFEVGENLGAGVLGAVYPLLQFIVEEGQNVGQGIVDMCFMHFTHYLTFEFM